MERVAPSFALKGTHPVATLFSNISYFSNLIIKRCIQNCNSRLTMLQSKTKEILFSWNNFETVYITPPLYTNKPPLFFIFVLFCYDFYFDFFGFSRLLFVVTNSDMPYCTWIRDWWKWISKQMCTRHLHVVLLPMLP